ncbi:MAG: ferrous iron transporter B, partial [Aestuariibacter sp.]|nr:ferrous iron transporter B [Aestuariibacter sp.]
MQRILMVGKPNCGKSLLFNQLTGLRQKVANYPGITVEVTRGKFDKFELVDLPGAYSLNGLTRDEVIAVEEIKGSLADEDTRVVLVVLDATRLAQSLILGLQVKQLAAAQSKPVMFALNFIDEVKRVGEHIDSEGLSNALGSPVMPLSARSLDGLHEFKHALLSMADWPNVHDNKQQPALDYSDVATRSQALASEFGIQHDIVLKNQNRIDSFMLNNWTGGLIFIAVMFVLFQSIFTLAAPLMDGVEGFIEQAASGVASLTQTGIFHDFVNDALFGGVGSFLVFVPQIMVLTLIIGLLEDSGYLARAALMCHRPLSFFGLSGRSFIPYLSGHACAIPAIMAARTIESPHKRLITMLTIPLMSCSAR